MNKRVWNQKRTCILLALLCIALIFSSFSFAGDDKRKFAVVVTTVSLDMNHIITESDVRIMIMDSIDSRDAIALNDVIGKRVKRPIGLNNVVKKDYLQDTYGVKKGDTVILIVQNGNLKISTKGVVREDGAVGDIVRVENASSGKIINGRVVELGMVEVNF